MSAEVALEAVRRRGAFYTPEWLADALVERSFASLRRTEPSADGASINVLDPACGDGVFLDSVRRFRSAAGVDPTVSRPNLFGMDIDAGAVGSCQARLGPGADIRVGDALFDVDARTPGSGAFADVFVRHGGFDLVVGNPPFLNRLRRAQAPDREYAARLRARFGAHAGGYADVAGVFLAQAVEIVRPGGVVAFVLPRSLLSTRDANAIRQVVARRAALETVWWSDDDNLFDHARVRVCAIVVVRDREQAAIGRFRDRAWRSVAPLAASDFDAAAASGWGSLTDDGDGDWMLGGNAAGTIGDLAAVTADFRDQYYGIVPYVREGGGPHQLVTCGTIDPLTSLWGQRPVRFAKRTWAAPTVDAAALRADAPALRSWLDARTVPKVLVATQTRIVECTVDVDGSCVPCVPVVTVVPAPDHLWRVAAALSAPVVTRLALRSYRGAARSIDAIKLSAQQIAALPLPADPDAWERATALATVLASGRRSTDQWRAFAVAANAAYGIDDAGLVAWWLDRLPRRIKVDG